MRSAAGSGLMESKAANHLKDLLTFACDALDFPGELDAAQLAGNKEKPYAVCRAVELIGEAANRVPQADQAAMPFIAWSQIIAMRNRIIHGYHAVDAGMLVSTVRDHLPTLCERLERAIGDRPDEC